ncbi:MAG: sialate O-acetylesterase [Cyclobacteriaceae bacterium]
MKADIIIIAGQSNAIGVRRRVYTQAILDSMIPTMSLFGFTVDKGDPVPDGVDQVHEGVYMLDVQNPYGSDAGISDELLANPALEITNPLYRPYDPRPSGMMYNEATDTGQHSFSWDLKFAKEMYLRTGRVQLIIKVAIGGTALVNDNPAPNKQTWSPNFTGDRSCLEFAERTITRGLAAAVAQGYTLNRCVMLWDQGESDQIAVVASYKSYFLALHNRIRISSTVSVLPVLIRRVFVGNPPLGAQIAADELAAENSYIFTQDFRPVSDDEAHFSEVPISPIDNIHILPKGLCYIGYRMAHKYSAFYRSFNNQFA